MTIYTDIADEIIKLIADEFTKQGHTLTGAFESKMTYDVSETSGGVRIRVYDNTEQTYGKILDAGVRADQIKFPYARKRIAGLTNWAKLRLGAGDKEAVSIAYAVATTHAREGMPTPGSVQYSSTGKRTDFVADATKDIIEITKRKLYEQIQTEILTV